MITEGIEILDPGSTLREASGGTHNIIVQHPAIRDAEWLLDIGCGTGWSSLHFARQGHKVVGFDPSTPNMRLAKQYAISQGEYIEYMGAAVGFLSFRPDVFDAVIALHSIHHVPDLKNEMKVVRTWMREGAGMGIDEHVRNDPMLADIIGRMHGWARQEVFPQVRTLPEEALAGLPRAEPSTFEGAGSHDVIQSFLDNFTLESFASRYISLDFFSFLFYLSDPASEASYINAGNVINYLYKFIYEAQPYNAEHVTMIGRKVTGESAEHNNELVERAERLARGNTSSPEDLINSFQEAITAKNRHISELEAWARSLERALLSAQRAEQHKSLPTRIRSRINRRPTRPKS
jgi:SAM-dependent methyltransferase